jgi:hypothetical protein
MKYLRLFENFNKLKHEPEVYIKHLRKWYILNHDLQSVRDINNGYCIEFSEHLQDLFDEDYGGKCDDLEILHSDYFFDEDNHTWDMDSLSKYGTPPNYINYKELPHHQWAIFNGKHYDAESPNGVNVWFELPIFRRYFKLK